MLHQIITYTIYHCKNKSIISRLPLGDLFERQEDIQDPDLWMKVAGSESPALQYENRHKILQLANYIIPGHGPGFYVTDELRKHHKNLEPKFRQKSAELDEAK